jgi:hypothetical protein
MTRRRDQEPPDSREARMIERAKAAGLFVVHPNDVDRPWADQRLVLTPLGAKVEANLRREHPDWFEGQA